MVAQGEETRAQVERILQSETFRNSEALRRLLRFLAEKSISGEADTLKEYTIAVDALGKSPNYDPRQDSVVRIQVGRLRQKLADYYRSEGKNDEIFMDLPKGHFRLIAEPRQVAQEFPDPIAKPAIATPEYPWRKIAFALAAIALASVFWAVYSNVQLSREQSRGMAEWTPEMEQVWSPFSNSHRPVLLSVAAPLFVGLQGAGLYRDLSINRWEDVLQSRKIAAIQQVVKSSQIVPRYYYTGVGEMNSVFQFGRLFAGRDMHVSLAKSSELSWQQLSDSNVIMVGAPRLFTDPLRNLPIDLEFVMDESGIHNLKPQPGEPALFPDQYPSLLTAVPPSTPDDGEIYALVTHRPGPLGSGDVESFSSNHSPGTFGAVRWFTDPASVSTLVSKLRDSSGRIPRYYQVVLKVRYKDAIPTEVSYVTHRAVRVPATTGAGK